MSEFDVIARHFTRPSRHTDLSVGDDCALVRVADGYQLAISSDMSVAGTHFFANAAPYDIGWKSLSVNVSDMAAMGAQAKWATLAIALPQILPSPFQGEDQHEGLSFTPTPTLPLKEGGGINEGWLAEFSRGFFACADVFGVDLIGGDTTRGPLNISVTIMGEVPIGKALRRDGAQAGDDIWISGQLGSAALGLSHLQGNIQLTNDLELCLKALHNPMPRVALGLALRGIANSCIDISDGLLADLGHILKASNLGATIHLEQTPCLDSIKTQLENPIYQTAVLAGGDDYELCFTAPTNQREAIESLSKTLSLPITRIGTTRIDSGLQAMYKNAELKLAKHGFNHF